METEAKEDDFLGIAGRVAGEDQKQQDGRESVHAAGNHLINKVGMHTVLESRVLTGFGLDFFVESYRAQKKRRVGAQRPRQQSNSAILGAAFPQAAASGPVANSGMDRGCDIEESGCGERQRPERIEAVEADHGRVGDEHGNEGGGAKRERERGSRREERWAESKGWPGRRWRR